MTPCGPGVGGAGDGLNPRQAEELLQRITNLAKQRSAEQGIPTQQALNDIAGEIMAEERTMNAIYERNALLSIRAKRQLKEYAKRFKTLGDGVLAKLQGSSRAIAGARDSVDYNSKALHGKYFGRLVAELDEAGVLSDFKRADPDLIRDIYREMGASHPGRPAKQVTNNEKAFKIAQIVDGVTAELVARQNRAGGYIRRLPGYITRQTHDQSAIRALGSGGTSAESRQQSYRLWRDFTLPLLDPAKTFMGIDPEKFMRNIHEGLYSGVHGPAHDEANVMGYVVRDDLGKKISQSRVLHFKDADSAFLYNQEFGLKEFKEQILHDLHVRARSIALMESLGPTPELNLRTAIRELQEEARGMEDAGSQVDSLNSWRIEAALNEITGKNEMSANPTLSNITGTVKVIAQMAKMGAVVLSSFADKAFLQAEMAYQGISNLQTLGKQITTFFPRPREQKQFLRYLGVAMDGIMGNALSRYSNHSTVSGWGHTMQKWFFDLNGLNAWTDANKAGAAELLAAHLGEHAGMSFDKLPGELSRVLSLYNITPQRWDAMRSTGVNARGAQMILPDNLRSLSDEAIARLVVADGLTPTEANMLRERNRLETALRTYYVDRVDYAVPTPGAAERKYGTWNTRAGTPLGEAMRMLMMFKSFPITVMRKILGREIYGRGADTLRDWLLHDHRGKFNFAMLVAMGTVAGYVGGAARDALRGRTPKPLLNDEGEIHWSNLNDAMIRGGSLGILGDFMLSQYDADSNNFLKFATGPVLGHTADIADIWSRAREGENVAAPAEKLLLANAPLINLFYIRPVLDYLILWNLQEMMTPGSLRRMESGIERRNNQGFFVRPSETVR